VRGAQSRWATVALALVVASTVLLALGLPLMLSRALAQEQPASAPSGKEMLQAQYSQAIALYEEAGELSEQGKAAEAEGDTALAQQKHEQAGAKLTEAKAAFERVESLSEDLGIPLGPKTKARIAKYLTDIDAALATPAVAAAAEPVEAEGRTPAEQAEAQAVSGPTSEQKARIAELEKQYTEAVKLHTAGKLKEAREMFHAIAAAGVREGLVLSYDTEKGLRNYIDSIDREIAEAEQARLAEEAERQRRAAEQRRAAAEREAALKRLAGKIEVAEEYYAAGKLDDALAVLQSWEDEALTVDVPDEQTARVAVLREKIDAAMVAQAQAAVVPERPEAVEEAPAAVAVPELPEEYAAGMEPAPPTEAGAPAAVLAPEQELMEQVTRRESVRRARFQVYMDELLVRAQTLMDENDYEGARAALNLVLTRAEVEDVPASVEARYTERAEELLAQVDKEEAKYKAAMEKARQKAAEKQAAEMAKYERETREKQIKRLFRRADELVDDERYDEAKGALRAILELEPTNGQAWVMLDQVNRAQSRASLLETSDERAEEIRTVIETSLEATVPVGDRETLVYPKNWKELTEKRLAAMEKERMAETVVDQTVRDKLQRPVTFNFVDTPLDQVVQFLQTVTGINIVVDQRVLTAGEYRITLSLTDVPLEDALDFALEMVGLRWIVRKGVIFISDTQGVQAEPYTRIYDIRDLIGDVPNYAGPTFDLEQATGGGGGGTSGGGGGGFSFEDEEDEEDIEVFVSAEQSGQDVAAMIQENVARDTWGLGGRNSIAYRDGNLIVVNNLEVHKEIQELLDGLRKTRALQVSMDIRFIRVSDNFLISVGAGIRNFSYTTAENTVTTSIDPGGALLTGSSLGLSQPAFRTTGAFSQLINRVQFDYFLEAVQGDQGAVTLDSQRITVFNGQRAYIAVTTQQNIVTDFDVDVSESAVGFDPTITTLNTGSVFDVRPIVSADRRYVQIDLRPSLASLTSIDQFSTGTVILPDGSEQELFIQQPIIEVTELRTTASVPDGGSLLVGGQKVSFESRREVGTPVLSQIPILNRFITASQAIREKDNLLILVTPRIIMQEEREAEIQ